MKNFLEKVPKKSRWFSKFIKIGTPVARSTMRHRSRKDYREHSPCHQHPAVRVRRHWRSTLQGRDW